MVHQFGLFCQVHNGLTRNIVDPLTARITNGTLLFMTYNFDTFTTPTDYTFMTFPGQIFVFCVL